MGLFCAKPVRPATIPTDTIIPLHHFDNTPSHRAFVLDFTLRFDDVLDHEKMRLALVRLVELGNWRKLGARLRKNDAGKLEYHVPAKFDEERPGFRYHHIIYDTSIEDHSLASRLPKVSNRPTIQGDTTEFHCLARQSNTPKKLDDYLYSDEPQLSIQIVSFEDATLVSVTWPHTFLDAMGLRALFDAWILVLRGQEDQLPPFYGFDVDPVANLGDSSPVEPYVLADRQLKGLSFFVFVVRYVFDLLWWRKDEQRIVCLPSSYLQEMKQTAMHELVIHSKSERNPFISDGDIICAWWTRLAIQHMSRTSSRTVLIMNAFDLRTALSKDIIPLGAACMSNLSGVIYTSLPAYQIFQKPLSFVASQIRRSIQEQGTRSQVEAFVALHRKLTATTGRAPMFGDSSNQLVVFSNWHKGKFFSIDFSSVVVKEGIPVQKRATPLGQPSYLHANGFVNGYSSRNAFPIFGKDAAGNYWLGGQLPASFWPRIEEAVARM